MQATRSKARPEPLQDHDSPEFLFLWVFANTLGLLAGQWLGQWLGALIINILWPIPPFPPNALPNVLATNMIPRVIIAGFTTGTLIGILQKFVLHLYTYEVSWKWVAASILACVAFPALAESIYSPQALSAITLVTILGGVLLGILQWRILRQIVNRAGWWIPANAIAGPCLFGSITLGYVYSATCLGIMVSGITGSILLSLMKHPIRTFSF